MVIWLNGALGAGKTTTADAMLGQLPGSRLFDPEEVGFMLRLNLADHPVDDFQDWPPWRSIVVASAIELMRYTGEHLICPQSVLLERYFIEIETA